MDPSGAANVIYLAASLGAGAADAGAAYVEVLASSIESFGGSGDTGRLGQTWVDHWTSGH